MTISVVIIGAGGFGREVLDVVDAIAAEGGGLEPIGFIDDAKIDLSAAKLGVPLLGACRVLAELGPATRFVVAVNEAAARRRLVQRALSAGLEPVTLIHPSATIGRRVQIGEGSVVCAGVRITNNISIGSHCHINLNSTIGHDSVLENYVAVNPLVAISGNVHIQEGSMLGTGCAILQGLKVGRDVSVGGGAVVVKDVDDGSTVVGIPARPIGPS